MNRFPLSKRIISKLNEIALDDFERADAMLDGVNLVLGTQYGWLKKRVVFFDNPNVLACDKYKNVHDAWIYAED